MQILRIVQTARRLRLVAALPLALCGIVPLAMAKPPAKKPPGKSPSAHPAAPTPHPSPAPTAPPSPADPPPLSTIPVSDDGEVGWWRGDDSPVDDMKLNNGTLTGGGYAPAMNGHGFRFTGRDDAVIVADSPSLALTRSMSVNVWVNLDIFPTPDENWGMILFRGDDRGGLDPYTLGVNPDQRLVFHIESEKNTIEISAPMPGRRFIMLTAILDDFTGKMELYENTVLVAHATTTVRPLHDLDPSQHAAIGIGNCNALPGSGYRFPFHGIINDLRIWSRVLAPGEIRSLYAGSLSVPSPLVQPR